MVETGLLNILFDGGVAAGGLTCHELLCRTGRDSEIEHQGFSRQVVNVVLQMFNPGDEGRAVRGRGARGLVGEVRADVAVGEHDFAFIEGCFQARLGFKAIARIEQGAEVRVNRFERAKVAVQELTDHFAEPGVVLRETGGINGIAGGDESFLEQIDLRALAAAVDAFDGDEFSRWSHVRRPV